ncbi:MAG: hypothetical protein ACOZNI_01255, partial [Myxococcota bacterium]
GEPAGDDTGGTTPVEEVPGGFVEPTTSTDVRARPTAEEIAAFVPAAGETFTFPEPWGTEAVRLTDDDTCGGADCVSAVGYSYWRVTNAHEGRDAMSILLGIDGQLALLHYDKATGGVSRGELLLDGSPIAGTGEQVFWSGSDPDRLYVMETGLTGRMLAVDVAAGASTVVYDATEAFGDDAYVWQPHASDDDRVHSFTLREYGTWATLGCVVWFADTEEFVSYVGEGAFDECQVDRSGRWLLIKENVDGAAGEDNRVVDLETSEETLLLDQDGAGGHSDNGHGYTVAADNWNALPGAVRLWDLASPVDGELVYHEIAWEAGLGHVTHTNARADVAPEEQFACASNATTGDYARSNEILCFPLDGSLEVLIVAPVMTDLDAPGGGAEAYYKYPKGNLDVTGRYFVWTTNLGGDRLDAFLVKVPAHLLD